MININTPIKNKKVKEYLIHLNKVQDELNSDEELIYPLIPLNVALKYNIVFNDFLFHELVLAKRMFYEDIVLYSKKQDVLNLIIKVLEFEFLNDNTLQENTLNKLIKLHKKMSNDKK